ncbi:hypothetical protein [Halosimplex amylolyticum]|uniref:hypothetical protein n=1 Tax=Halosimplex amylolyticum TaxID=3396616 RepID=UPI003F57C98B
MTDAEPVVKRAECPHEGCSAHGRAVVPGGVDVVATSTTNGGIEDAYDGIVYGHCPDHEFYAYYRARPDREPAGVSSDGEPADEDSREDGSMATE